MGVDDLLATEQVRLSDMFWTVHSGRGVQCYLRDGLVCAASNVFCKTPEMGELGDRDVYGYSLPTFCEALLSTDWQSPEAVLAYHDAYGLYWRGDYEARFTDGSAPLAYALARFQAEILSLRTAVDLAAALRARDCCAARRLVSRCEKAKHALFKMCERRHGGDYYGYAVDTNTWHERGENGTAVRFHGNRWCIEEDADFKLVIEPVPLLPGEWETIRDAWAQDEVLPLSGDASALSFDDLHMQDAVAEISDILRVPCIRPYFESRGGLDGLRFFLSWELHALADFVRLGIAMYLSRGLLPVHCASESCQRYFIPTRPRQTYCSKECQRAQAVRRYRRRQKEQSSRAKGPRKKRRYRRNPKA